MQQNLPMQFKNSNSIIILLALLPFILPIIYTIVNGELVFLGSWYILFAIYLVIYLVRGTNATFSDKSIILFFTGILISFSYTSVSAYLSFNTPARDPGIFFSMIQAMLMGKFGYSAVTGNYHFATHQNYILLVILPIYFVSKSAVCVQLTGSTVIWAAGAVLWKISRLYLNQLISLCLVISYYATPVSYFYAFRPELFFPLAIMTLYYVVVTRKNWLILILSSIFLLSIKEDAPLYMLGFIYILLRQKNYARAIILCLLNLFIIWLNIAIVQPYFVLKNGEHLASTLMFYTQWGHNNREILFNLVTNPYKIIKLLLNSHSGFWHLYGYWLFLPLISPMLILSSIIPLILFTTSNNMHMYSLNEYYPIALNSFIFLAIIEICSKLIELSQSGNQRWAKFIQSIILYLIVIHPLLYIKPIIPFNLGNPNMSYGRWQEFRPISLKNLHDFNLLRQKLQQDYSQQNICPANQLYPHLDIREFKNLQPFAWERINQKNCINVFSTTGDMWPVSPASAKIQINQMLTTQKCKKYGEFYYCNNQY